MSKYRLKKQYFPSKGTTTILRGAFIVAVIALLFELAALFLPAETLTVKGGLIATVIFLVAFCAALLMLMANIVLWIGMLHFLVVYDGSSSGRKAFWGVITFLGLSAGAALYYWFVYRSFIAGAPQAEPNPQIA